MKEIQETFKDNNIEKIEKDYFHIKGSLEEKNEASVNKKSSDFNINCEVVPIQITVLTNLRSLMRICN